MKRTVRSRWSFAALSILVAACGGGSSTSGASNDLTEEQAGQAFDSMAVALNAATGDATATIDDQGGTGSVTLTDPCSNGGNVTADAEFVKGTSLNIDIGFNKCIEGAITVDGSLTYEGTGNSTMVTITVTGRLDFTGSVKGSCEIDATLLVTQTNVSVTGKMCGFDIDASQMIAPPTRR